MTAESSPGLRLNVVSEDSRVFAPEGFGDFGKERIETRDWYNEQLRKLPERRVDPFAWNQPIMVQRSEEFLDSKGETDRVSEIVLLLINPWGRVFVSVSQEPGIKAQAVEGKEIHPVVHTPFQASVEKLRQLAGGNEKVDPTLYAVLGVLSKDESIDISAILQDLPLTKVPTDGNRTDSNVLYGKLRLTKEEADLLSEKVPQGKFVHQSALEVLPLNGHLHIALSASVKRTDSYSLITI